MTNDFVILSITFYAFIEGDRWIGQPPYLVVKYILCLLQQTREVILQI